MAKPRPLWKCPRCGVKLVAKNLSHSCGDYSIEKFLAGKGKKARALFARFVSLVDACGDYDIAPAQTRVAFLVRVRFASVNRVADEAIDVHFVLPRSVESARFRRVEQVGNVWVHHLRLTKLSNFDRQLSAWLRASREEYGEQKWLEAQGPSRARSC